MNKLSSPVKPTDADIEHLRMMVHQHHGMHSIKVFDALVAYANAQEAEAKALKVFIDQR